METTLSILLSVLHTKWGKWILFLPCNMWGKTRISILTTAIYVILEALAREARQQRAKAVEEEMEMSNYPCLQIKYTYKNETLRGQLWKLTSELSKAAAHKMNAEQTVAVLPKAVSLLKRKLRKQLCSKDLETQTI